MSEIYLIGGKAQNGKDTLAINMKNYWESRGYKVLILHFADYVKFLCRSYFGWDGTKSEQGRYILQHIGTDVIRAKFPDFWRNAVRDLIQVMETEYDYYIVPDTRFFNELNMTVDGMLRKTVRVIRLNFESPLTLEQQNHISETELDNAHFDWVVYPKTLDDNRVLAENIAEESILRKEA